MTLIDKILGSDSGEHVRHMKVVKGHVLILWLSSEVLPRTYHQSIFRLYCIGILKN